MQLHLQKTSPQKTILPPCALTIGNFDGVHRGHLALLLQLRKLAKAQDLPTAVLTFEPLPLECFRPEQAPPRLNSIRDRIDALRDTGLVDHLIVQKFQPNFAQIPADKFVQDILIKRFHSKMVLVGDDFRFGAQRAGDLALLKQYQAFSTHALATQSENGIRISSTAIRQALAAGDLALARQFLGRDYAISGRVVHGKKLGRQLGFPTANLAAFQYQPALSGIFIVQADTPLGTLRGAASLGINPSVDHDTRYRLEIHFLDFAGDLYGAKIRVTFLKKLRDEAKFDSLEALRAQIEHDLAQTRAFFQNG